MFLIYKHTSPSGKSYIGQTSNYEYRSWRHNRDDNKCRRFAAAIKKYGWENFTHEILADNLTQEEANKLEEHYILDHNTLTPHGYNLTTGGDGKQCSEETKAKISAARTGKPRSEKTKNKIRDYWLANPHSEEHIVKMQEARNATRRPLTPEERAKISEKLKGRKKTPEELARRKATIEAKKRAAIEAALCADADN